MDLRGTSCLAVYTGSGTYWQGPCLFMSLPLTNSVLTQHQEMINTAKRCNVRMGVDGERGGSKWVRYPSCISVLRQRSWNENSTWRFGRDYQVFFYEKHTEAGLSAILSSCVPGELNPHTACDCERCIKCAGSNGRSLTKKNRPHGSQEVTQRWINDELWPPVQPYHKRFKQKEDSENISSLVSRY